MVRIVSDILGYCKGVVDKGVALPKDMCIMYSMVDLAVAVDCRGVIRKPVKTVAASSNTNTGDGARGAAVTASFLTRE